MSDQSSSWDELPELDVYPKLEINPAYLDYIKEKQEKAAQEGQGQTPLDSNMGRHGQETTLKSKLTQGMQGYSKAHPSEAKLPKDVLERRAVYGTFLGSQIEGPVNWDQFFTDWGQIGPQLLVTPSFRLPLDKSEVDFCAKHGITFLKELGRGGYGVVWMVEYKQLSGRLACKVIDLSELRSPPGQVHDVPLKQAVDEMFREADILKMLNHPNVVKLEHIFHIHDPKTGFPFIRILLFMELCQGDLAQLIEQHPNKKFTEEEARPVMVDICRGLKYLHDHNVVHFDIKPNNILFLRHSPTAIRCYKLTDFGLAKRFASLEDSYVASAGGTFNYSAPELDLPGYSKAKSADIYSLGTVLLVLLVGKKEAFQVRHQLASLWDQRQYSTMGLSNEVGDLARRMTFNRFENRPSIEQVMAHSWFTSLVG